MKHKELTEIFMVISNKKKTLVSMVYIEISLGKGEYVIISMILMI